MSMREALKELKTAHGDVDGDKVTISKENARQILRWFMTATPKFTVPLHEIDDMFDKMQEQAEALKNPAAYLLEMPDKRSLIHADEYKALMEAQLSTPPKYLWKVTALHPFVLADATNLDYYHSDTAIVFDAYRVKDYADDWILFFNFEDAKNEVRETGAAIQGLVRAGRYGLNKG